MVLYRGVRYEFERQQWFGEQDDGQEVPSYAVGLRHLTPVPWSRFKFYSPDFSELALTTEGIEESTSNLSAGKTVDAIMVRSTLLEFGAMRS